MQPGIGTESFPPPLGTSTRVTEHIYGRCVPRALTILVLMSVFSIKTSEVTRKLMSSISKFHDYLKMVCLYYFQTVSTCGYVHMSAEAHRNQGRQMAWTWRYRQLWLAWHGFWELSWSPLKEHSMLLTAGSSLQPSLMVFKPLCPDAHSPRYFHLIFLWSNFWDLCIFLF